MEQSISTEAGVFLSSVCAEWHSSLWLACAVITADNDGADSSVYSCKSASPLLMRLFVISREAAANQKRHLEVGADEMKAGLVENRGQFRSFVVKFRCMDWVQKNI